MLMNFMHFHNFRTRNGDYHIPLIKTGNAHEEKMLPPTIINIFKSVRERDQNKNKIDGCGEMMVAFTMTKIKYLMASIFCELAWSLSYIYLWYQVHSLHYLPCFRHSYKSDYAFPKVIHDILKGAHQPNLFSNKIFFLNSVFQILRFMVLF